MEITDRSFLEKDEFQVPFANILSEGTVELPEDFEPSSTDIICGRGKSCWNHCGNRRFRLTIAMSLKRYVDAKTKIDKSQVVHSIVDQLRQSSSVGSFIKKNYRTGRWMSMSDDVAREKVGHALRDSLSAIKRSQREVPFGAELDQQEALIEAERAIFRSLDLVRNTRAPSRMSSYVSDDSVDSFVISM